jgi:hypothetical protein
MIQLCLAHRLEDYCDDECVEGLDVWNHRKDRVTY